MSPHLEQRRGVDHSISMSAVEPPTRRSVLRPGDRSKCQDLRQLLLPQLICLEIKVFASLRFGSQQSYNWFSRVVELSRMPSWEASRTVNGSRLGLAVPVALIALVAALESFIHPIYPSGTVSVQALYTVPIFLATIRGGWFGSLIAITGMLIAMAWLGYSPIQADWDGFFAGIPIVTLAGVAGGRVFLRWQAMQRQINDLRSELRDRDGLLSRGEKMSAAGELAVGLAHELQHPASSIRGIAVLLRDEGLQPEARSECLMILERECLRIDRLLRELLEFAKPQPTRVSLFCANEIVDESIALVRHSSKHGKVEFRKAIDPALKAVMCDRDQVKQVLVNLLLNAGQAMQEGGLVVVRVVGQDKTAKVEVIDEGSGIATEILDKVFCPFVTTRKDGTGLGLSIAKRIVTQHGGELVAEKNPDRGMTFRFTLPFATGSGQ